MSSAKRRINSTGRRLIPLSAIDITVPDPAAGEHLKVSLTMSLEALQFPGDACVLLEAFNQYSTERIDCGTVAQPKPIDNLPLKEIDQSLPVRFCLKVISVAAESGVGKILGASKPVQASSTEEKDGYESIFPVRICDLGQEVWRVSVDGDSLPTLLLNNRVAGIRHQLVDSPILSAAILPGALRIVLAQLIQDPAGDWQEKWVEYCRDGLGMDEAPDSLEKGFESEWIDQAIENFCRQHSFVDRIRAAIEAQGD